MILYGKLLGFYWSYGLDPCHVRFCQVDLVSPCAEDIFIVTSSLWEIIVDFTHMLGEQPPSWNVGGWWREPDIYSGKNNAIFTTHDWYDWEW